MAFCYMHSRLDPETDTERNRLCGKEAMVNSPLLYKAYNEQNPIHTVIIHNW